MSILKRTRFLGETTDESPNGQERSGRAGVSAYYAHGDCAHTDASGVSEIAMCVLFGDTATSGPLGLEDRPFGRVTVGTIISAVLFAMLDRRFASQQGDGGRIANRAKGHVRRLSPPPILSDVIRMLMAETGHFQTACSSLHKSIQVFARISRIRQNPHHRTHLL